MADQAYYEESKKFMWDGEEYNSDDQAATKEKEYAEKGFEVRTVRKGGKVFLYTRRVVTEIVLDGG